MHEYEEIIQLAMDKGYGEEVHEATEKLVNYVAKADPQMYERYMLDLKKLAYKIPVEEAERIVKAMRPRGQYWSYSQIKEYLKEKGIEHDCVNWYLVMNMAYNDFFETAKVYGHQNDVEFFYCLARDFISDPDAKPFKVEKYFLE